MAATIFAIVVPARRLANAVGGGPRSSDYGTLAEIAGRKLIYLLGFTLFGVLSRLCGVANAVRQPILLGLTGAGLGANSFVIPVKAGDPERQGQAVGIFAAAPAVGIGFGPRVGGVLPPLTAPMARPSVLDRCAERVGSPARRGCAAPSAFVGRVGATGGGGAGGRDPAGRAQVGLTVRAWRQAKVDWDRTAGVPSPGRCRIVRSRNKNLGLPLESTAWAGTAGQAAPVCVPAAVDQAGAKTDRPGYYYSRD